MGRWDISTYIFYIIFYLKMVRRDISTNILDITYNIKLHKSDAGFPFLCQQSTGGILARCLPGTRHSTAREGNDPTLPHLWACAKPRKKDEPHGLRRGLLADACAVCAHLRWNRPFSYIRHAYPCQKQRIQMRQII